LVKKLIFICMKKELEEKLYKEFPLLYAEHKLPMSHTCMCWGFEHSDGWYNLIYKLSSKLERLIKKQMDETKIADKECVCGCKLTDHNYSMNNTCTTVHKISYYPFKNNWFTVPKSKPLMIYKSILQKFKLWINMLCKFISPVIYKKVKCSCKGYEEYHATASQVKEKFGTLRFYGNNFTDEMDKLVDAAERKSAKTCEYCGKPGKQRNGGWVRTLCNTCNKTLDKEEEIE